MEKRKFKVLFVCIHNSARSQLAEAYLNKLGSEFFEAESAGLEPGALNPNVVAVLKNDGIDIANKSTQGVSKLLEQKKEYDFVITVCDGANAERCPVFPGKGKRLAWFFTDPSQFKGTNEEILEATHGVKEEIKFKVTEFLNDAHANNFWNS